MRLYSLHGFGLARLLLVPVMTTFATLDVCRVCYPWFGVVAIVCILAYFATMFVERLYYDIESACRPQYMPIETQEYTCAFCGRTLAEHDGEKLFCRDEDDF